MSIDIRLTNAEAAWLTVLATFSDSKIDGILDFGYSCTVIGRMDDLGFTQDYKITETGRRALAEYDRNDG